jgi:hypothetical protein
MADAGVTEEGELFSGGRTSWSRRRDLPLVTCHADLL